MRPGCDIIKNIFCQSDLARAVVAIGSGSFLKHSLTRSLCIIKLEHVNIKRGELTPRQANCVAVFPQLHRALHQLQRLWVFATSLQFKRSFFRLTATGRFALPNRPLDASRLRRAEGEGMSRRSSGYKGGVTRGREEQPQGNSTMKRGSPTTKRASS